MADTDVETQPKVPTEAEVFAEQKRRLEAARRAMWEDAEKNPQPESSDEVPGGCLRL